MGLKVQRDDFLEKILEEFVILPTDEKEKKNKEEDLERFLNPKPKKEKDKK